MTKNLDTKIFGTKDLRARRFGLTRLSRPDHDRSGRGLWTRSDVTRGCGNSLDGSVAPCLGNPAKAAGTAALLSQRPLWCRATILSANIRPRPQQSQRPAFRPWIHPLHNQLANHADEFRMHAHGFRSR